MHEGEAPPEAVTLQVLLSACGCDLAGLPGAALMSLAYGAGLRVSELVAVAVGDLQQLADGSGRFAIAQSKTDQMGEGR